MKKLILTLTILIAVIAINAQTNYAPIVAESETAWVEGDTSHRVVTIRITHWDNTKLEYGFTGKEYRNGVAVPYMIRHSSFDLMMDETYTFYNPYPSGTALTHTGRWFVEAVYEGGAINWDLVIVLGQNIYHEYIDPNGWFVKP